MNPPDLRPLRVYWLTEAFYPPIVGGQELFAARVVQALATRGVTVSVITRQPGTVSPARERIGAVDVRRIPPAGVLKGKGWRALLPLLSYLTRLLFLLLREAGRYDVIIVSGVKVMPLIVVPLCLLTGKKCILRVESFFELKETISAESLREMRGPTSGLLVKGIDSLRMFMLRRAGRVVAISTEIAATLHARGVAPQRIAQIPNAVDLQQFRPVATVDREQLRGKLGLPQDRTLLIFAGRLSRAKGLLMLVEAWPELLRAYPDLYLVIVGSGKQSFDDCESQARDLVGTNRMQHDVQFCGESDHVHEYLQAVDLFIFPTEYEGFSLALVEALGSALPVVVTAVGAAPDLIQHGENGFLFPPQDPAALVRTMEEALACRPRWQAIGHAARATAKPYDLATVTDRYVRLCEELTADVRRVAK